MFPKIVEQFNVRQLNGEGKSLSDARKDVSNADPKLCNICSRWTRRREERMMGIGMQIPDNN